MGDRKIIDWAKKSGVWTQNWNQSKGEESNDKPSMNFGIPTLDDGSVSQVLSALSPALCRDLVVMQLQANLTADQRQSNLKLYPASLFKRVAMVVMGEPPQAYKDKVQELMLADKKEKAEADKKQKAKEAEDRPWNRRKKEDDKDDSDEKEEKEKDAEAADEKEKAVELTEEEKGKWHRERQAPDISKT